MIDNYKCGYIALVGRPNVGKSTLLNALLDTHLSITSKKPQTTQQQILGIKTTDKYQVIFVDTPGLHAQYHSEIHRLMNRQAATVLADMDVLIFMVQALKWTEQDEYVLRLIQREAKKIPVILVVNKIDRIKDKALLLPFLQQVSGLGKFERIIPISAVKGAQITDLETEMLKLLPHNLPFYDSEQLTDKNDRFLAAERVREQIMRLLGDELPYACAVQIEHFEEQEHIINISAVVWVEKARQKSILIGRKGAQLKAIGTRARHSLQQLFAKKVLLRLWVKEKTGWSQDQQALKSLGFGTDS